MSTSSTSISIVLADDHPVVLHGVAGILRAQPEMNVLAACSDGTAATNAIRLFAPDIAVLDIAMPGRTGLDVLSDIATDGFRTKVVFLTAVASDEQILA